MKTKTKLLLVSVLVLILISAEAIEDQKSQWKGKIEYENGIKIIRNPKRPLYGEITFKLEEDLIIGNEEDENYMFYKTWDVKVDKQGNIYILDRGNFRIQKYNNKGRYIQTIGRKGQGPGEFESPRNIFIDPENNIYVNQARKISIFDEKGNFIKSVPLEIPIQDFCIDSKENIFAIAFQTSKNLGVKNVIVKLDSNGKEVKVFEESLETSALQFLDGYIATMVFASNPYHPNVFFNPLAANSLSYCISSEYELIIIDNNGSITLKIQKDVKPEPITRRERKNLIEKMHKGYSKRDWKMSKTSIEKALNFPPHRPFFDKVITDDKHRLYVRLVKSHLDKSSEIVWDIFSDSGYFLYKAMLPVEPKIIRDGYIFTIETSEETGFEIIKRYKIKNWDQIKEGI